VRKTMTNKILPVKTCWNCGHCFDAKTTEGELCPLCDKEVDSLFDDDGDIDFNCMHDEVDLALADMLES
jgi:rRNA maturation endonuclease Nob1